jgi:hypothetical protein
VIIHVYLTAVHSSVDEQNQTGKNGRRKGLTLRNCSNQSDLSLQVIKFCINRENKLIGLIGPNAQPKLLVVLTKKNVIVWSGTIMI